MAIIVEHVILSVADAIREKLSQALTPSFLNVIDQSHLHAGHAGAGDGVETHFRVEIEAAAFAGLSRLERHRLVNGLLADELAGPVHALSVDARPPTEQA